MTYTFDGDIVSDLHKDAYGFRPGLSFWYRWNDADDAGKQDIWDNLLIALDFALKEQERTYAEAKAAFEFRIAECIALGANDRATAIRWVVDSLNLTESDKMYGAEYICYTLGLPYSMQSEFVDVA